MATVHQLILQHGVEEARKAAIGGKNDRLCVEAAYGVLSDEEGRIGVVHAGFAMTALPHKRMADAVWERDGGQVKLLVESGLDSRKQQIGIPYGSCARMILLYLQTQAVRTHRREIPASGYSLKVQSLRQTRGGSFRCRQHSKANIPFLPSLTPQAR